MRSQALAAVGRPADALRDLDLLKPAAEDQANLWRGYGVVRRQSGDLPGAMEALDKAIALEPAAVRVYAWKGTTLALMGEHGKAEAAFKAGLDKGHNAIVLAEYALFRAACPNGEFRDAKAARAMAEEALKLASADQSPAARAALAAALAEGGDFTTAAAEQKKVLADKYLWPSHKAEAERRLKLYEAKKPLRIGA